MKPARPGIDASECHAVGALAMLVLLCGCASMPTATPGGLLADATAVSTEPPPLTAEQQALLDRRTRRIEELLSQPLTAEAAAEIALLQNPAVERALETLGMPGFDRLLLAHTINPAFNGGRPPGTIDTRIERPLSVNAMTWVSVPALAEVDIVDSLASRLQAADEIVALLFIARRAWVEAVAARQSLRYLEDVGAEAEAGRDIMEGMRQVGNASELELLRAQTLYADAIANMTTSQLTAAVRRERLVQALGLWGADADRVRLPERLPDLPPAAIGPEGLEDRAVAQRFDVRAGRVEGLAGEAGVNARSDLRTAWLGYRAAYDLARLAGRSRVAASHGRCRRSRRLSSARSLGWIPTGNRFSRPLAAAPRGSFMPQGVRRARNEAGSAGVAAWSHRSSNRRPP